MAIGDRASGPIFIKRGVEQSKLSLGEVPSYVTKRLMSVRAYDSMDNIVEASVCDGIAVGDELTNYFRRSDVAYIHLHNAKRGCFSCQVNRA